MKTECTIKFLKTNKACSWAIDWVIDQETYDIKKLWKLLQEDGEVYDEYRHSWAIWLITKKLNRQDLWKYALYVLRKTMSVYRNVEEYIEPDDKEAYKAVLDYARNSIGSNLRKAKDATRNADACFLIEFCYCLPKSDILADDLASVLEECFEYICMNDYDSEEIIDKMINYGIKLLD